MAARVLVVEDDARVAASVRRSLEYAGYSVALASDGSGGLAAALRDGPDLVVLDVNLPGLDGFQVMQQSPGWGLSNTFSNNRMSNVAAGRLAIRVTSVARASTVVRCSNTVNSGASLTDDGPCTP